VPATEKTQPSNWFALARRSLSYLRPHRGALLKISALALTLGGLSAVEPLILKKIVDRLGQRGLGHGLATGVIALLGLGLVRELTSGFSNWMTWRTRLRVQYGLMEVTVGRLHQLPLSFHRADGVGATLTKLERGIQGFVAVVSEIGFNLVPTIVYLGLSAVVMIRLEPRLALVVLAFAPLPWIIASFAAPEQTRRERSLLDRWVRIYSRFNEVLSGIVTVKTFTMEDVEKRRFLHDVNSANQLVIRGVALDSGVGASQNLVIMLARIAAIGYGGVLVENGQISIGTVIAFLGYIGGLFGPVQGLSNTYKTLRAAHVSLEQVFSILDAQDHPKDATDACELDKVRGEVVFDNISFAYPPGHRTQIKGVDLVVRAGENLALVGPSGSGKSTLMALLCRFYDPTEGAIRVDGIDLRRIKQVSLRGQIGVVLQEPLLFNESVRMNLAYGRPSASSQELEEAARAANAHEFIIRLPQAYDTVVGERGCLLSAGERQRIAIARSILKDPAILVLDEPTSALDAESERLVHQALARLMKGRTTFSIAHRLSTVVDADRIVVLKAGQTCEQGTHHELMRRQGYYASLVRQLTDGFITRAA
jgi:ATP-binding cassette subfamily B protein